MSTLIKNKSVVKSRIYSAVSEIEIHYKRKVEYDQMPKVSSSQDAVSWLRKYWGKNRMDHIEQFMALYLSRSNRILGWSRISQGGQSGTVVDPKVVFQIALKSNAASIILAHNHPSGNINPSDNDKRLTDKLVTIGKLLELSVLDHLILTSESYLSFADEGLLN